MNNHITNRLIELVKEKHIAEDILDMKYAMEHKEKMIKICKNIKEMSCVVLNTVDMTDIEENTPAQTHLIFHYKIETDILMDEEIEHYIFAFQPDELHQYRYINYHMRKRGEIFLNNDEYTGLYNAMIFPNAEESNL